MQPSDWFAAIVGVIFLGAGAVMSTWRKTNVRQSGYVLIAVGVLGLAVWFGYFRDGAEAQGPAANCNISGDRNTFNNSCNTTINPLPRRDRTKLYQKDSPVASTDSPVFDYATKECRFGSIFDTNGLDPTQNVEFEDLVIKILGWQPEAMFQGAPGPGIGRPMRSNVYGNVICEIIGKRK